jgi:hypothetical protein
MSKCPSCGGPEHPIGVCPEWEKAHGELSRIGGGGAEGYVRRRSIA